MCGIFGAVGPPLPGETVHRVLATLRHRGPESDGTITANGATLGHTRLRIIDLSPAGAQPMANEDQTVWVTFNGEIYNFLELRRELERAGHRFTSHTDTEVLVHGFEEWGTDLVQRLDGMFAFGIWDARSRRLFLARDRAGKKPLFYAQHGGRFVFASEIKALFAAGVPPDISPEGVVGYLAYGYVPPPATQYRGVMQLLPAHRLLLEHSRPPRIDRYWSYDFEASGQPPGEAEAAVTVRTLLDAAVRKRMVADVPVGAFLSGGLDSTIVVGLMSRLGGPVRTFSIGFEGDPRYDETAFARIAARAFGTRHTEFRVKPADLEIVEKLVWHHDGPFGDSSAVPTYVVSRLTREHVTVALNGDGGDELFAGYLRFMGAAVTERIPAALRPLAGLAARLLPAGRAHGDPIARARRLLAAVNLPLGDRLARWNSFFAFSLDDVLQDDLQPLGATALEHHRRFFPAGDGRSPLALALNHNFGTYLPCDLLVKMDRTSMAHALETRSPFLDTALIDYVSGLPDRYKLRGRITKYILRRAFSDLLPPAIRRRGKMGFGVPLGTWFRGDLRAYLTDHIAAPGSRITDYVRPDAVSRMLAAHMAGTANHEHELWALLTMEIWLRNLPRLSRPWAEAEGPQAPASAVAAVQFRPDTRPRFPGKSAMPRPLRVLPDLAGRKV
jgi:asparagine synthase (glutamine-hydrolysing)